MTIKIKQFTTYQTGGAAVVEDHRKDGGLIVRHPVVSRAMGEIVREAPELEVRLIAEGVAEPARLAERTQRDPQNRMPVAEAFRDHEEFCRSLGANAGTAMTFSRAMTARGAKRDPHKGSGGRRFMGFRLRERLRQDFDDDADDFSRLI